MYSTVPLKAARHLDRSVREVMHDGCETLPASASLDMVARTMRDHQTHAVLITDGDAPLGWVTSRGMLHNHPLEWANARAGDAVTESVATVGADRTIEDAITAFIASGASHILVGDDGHDGTIGVIAESDLVRFVARTSEQDGEQADASR